MVDIVKSSRGEFPDCAITLSIGEKSRESYKLYKEAGTDRYLLRHEAADKKLYSLLHPDNMSIDNRKRCLWDLKELGFQVGAGFMVGAPYQTPEHLVSDIRFMMELKPDMIGIGPFLPHNQTPFANETKGSMKQCLNLISILRLIFPYALIPSTTALATIHPQGRQMGLKAGANVVMPNLSPAILRKLYSLYNDKACTDTEAAENIKELEATIEKIGYRLVSDKGDVKRGCC
jgi:biotin synthase